MWSASNKALTYDQLKIDSAKAKKDIKIVWKKLFLWRRICSEFFLLVFQYIIVENSNITHDHYASNTEERFSRNPEVDASWLKQQQNFKNILKKML